MVPAGSRRTRPALLQGGRHASSQQEDPTGVGRLHSHPRYPGECRRNPSDSRPVAGSRELILIWTRGFTPAHGPIWKGENRETAWKKNFGEQGLLDSGSTGNRRGLLRIVRHPHVPCDSRCRVRLEGRSRGAGGLQGWSRRPRAHGKEETMFKLLCCLRRACACLAIPRILI
jgi:hypothetical protein